MPPQPGTADALLQALLHAARRAPESPAVVPVEKSTNAAGAVTTPTAAQAPASAPLNAADEAYARITGRMVPCDGLLRAADLPGGAWLEDLRRARYDAAVAEVGLFAPELEAEVGSWLLCADMEDLDRIYSA